MPRKYFPKRSKKNTRRRVYPKMSFKQRVLSVVKQQSEMKHARVVLANTLSNNINATNGIFSLEPLIPQGDRTFEREGNSIRLHKVEIIGYVNWKPDPMNPEHSAFWNSIYNNTNIVRLSVLKQRSSGSGTAIAMNTPAGIFESNNLLENSEPYAGTLQNSLTDYNRDAFIVKKDMRIKMTGTATQDGTTVQIDGSSDMLKKVKYTMRFGKAGKLISYRTAGAQTSTNFPYFLTQVAHNSWDGTPPSFLSTEIQVKWYYTDN